MKTLFVLFLLFGASSLFAANDIDTSRFAVFQYNADKHYELAFKDVKPTELSRDEISTIFQIAEKSIKDYMSNPAHIQKYKNQGVKPEVYSIAFSDYKFQLVPVINENAGKEVWVNAICKSAVEDMLKYGTDWRANTLTTYDGGPCYFNLYINLKTDKPHDLIVNEFRF